MGKEGSGASFSLSLDSGLAQDTGVECSIRLKIEGHHPITVQHFKMLRETEPMFLF